VSYRKKHIKNKLDRIKQKKPIFLKLWFWILSLSCILIVLSTYFLLFYHGLQIEDIIISGNEKIETQDLRNFASQETNIKLIDFRFLKLGTKSILLLNSDKVTQNILNKFPIIEKLSLSKKYPKTLVLGIAERKPIGAYCVAESEEQVCFLIDTNGVTFEKLGVVPDNITIVRQAIEGEQAFTGEEIVDKNIINAIAEIQKNLKNNFQIDLKEALITSPLRINITTNENWLIYFNLDSDSDINAQLVKLSLLLKEEISPESRKNLQYIDLRFKDRAFYK